MDEKMTKRGDAQRWHFSHESLARFAYLLLAICAIINQSQKAEGGRSQTLNLEPNRFVFL